MILDVTIDAQNSHTNLSNRYSQFHITCWFGLE